MDTLFLLIALFVGFVLFEIIRENAARDRREKRVKHDEWNG